MVGTSFRRRNQLKPDLFWDKHSKVIQSNARFGLTDRLEVYLGHVRMPVVTVNRLRRRKGGH